MNGVINVYKPQNITSFDVVRIIKKISRIKKVGHTGTLDPIATGVLPICLGGSTKIVDFIMNEHKEYKAKLKLGLITDTYDREGKILKEEDSSKILEEEVVNCINSFKGEIIQIPPMYSAIKVKGERLYNLARKGIEIEREGRKINIYSIEVLRVNLPYVEFKVNCSKGTYIRSLCYDIGNKLGVGATMWELERTKTGIFSIENSINLEDINEENIQKFIIPAEKALSKYEKIEIDEYFSRLLKNGVKVKDKRLLDKIKANDILRVYQEDKFIGLGQKTKEGFKIVKLLV
ncbi:tRNA pseudouridine(55) synthase TruB [Clostridium tetani]|uniref:tRNA pseudouridine synthase B n=1 Tax=Clostridium tetani TaxID=1513 RepID=A0ABY0ELL8_CLOTA|nr:tRNA pseudouridine(55) synthase TruB [Clostridium tetani]KHO39372.1 tRNA pseudouridine synthase B [Clostridium tetani]RXI51770.1 tRNA pseudouridine(55) synthase TruB [Clostridium tetani]RXI74005.1 tRNA pseudouridine(55) synthase TruB [Clostridium tetani]CDI49376.1 tRNA pseudouridine synthase B [Clostridium tetani 12124569]